MELILTLFLMGSPVITGCRTNVTMGKLFEYWDSQKISREDNNWRWWIKRYEKGWEDKPPWYLKERFDEYLENR